MADPGPRRGGADGPQDRLDAVLRAALAAGADSSMPSGRELIDARSRVLAGGQRRRRRRAGVVAGSGVAVVLALTGLGLSGALSGGAGGGGQSVASPQVAAPSTKVSPLGEPSVSSGTCRLSGKTRQYPCGTVTEGMTPSSRAPSSAATPTSDATSATSGPTGTALAPALPRGANSAVSPAASGGDASGNPSPSGPAGSSPPVQSLRVGHAVTVRLPSGAGASGWNPMVSSSSPTAPSPVVTVTRVGHDELRITAHRAGAAVVRATDATAGLALPSCAASCSTADIWTLDMEVTT